MRERGCNLFSVVCISLLIVLLVCSVDVVNPQITQRSSTHALPIILSSFSLRDAEQPLTAYLHFICLKPCMLSFASVLEHFLSFFFPGWLLYCLEDIAEVWKPISQFSFHCKMIQRLTVSFHEHHFGSIILPYLV